MAAFKRTVPYLLGLIGMAITFFASWFGVRHLGWWAFPALFGVNIFFVALILFLPRSWIDRFDLSPHPRLRKFLDADPEGRGVHSRVARSGPWVLAIVVALTITPVSSVIGLRSIRTEERRAWQISIVCCAASAAFSVSFHMGRWSGLKEIFGM